MIIDTPALVAIFFEESEFDSFAEIIFRAERCRISAATFVELSMVLARKLDRRAGEECENFFNRANIQVEPFTREQALLANQAFWRFGKGRHPAGLNLGDCFSYALAKSTGEPLLFKSQDFSQTDLAFAI